MLLLSLARNLTTQR